MSAIGKKKLSAFHLKPRIFIYKTFVSHLLLCNRGIQEIVCQM